LCVLSYEYFVVVDLPLLIIYIRDQDVYRVITNLELRWSIVGYFLALILVVSTLFSPYSLLGGAVALTAWFALGRICGKERAIIVI
jgi:hypothetical protein